MVKKAAILVLVSLFCVSAFGMQAETQVKKVGITIGEAEYEWWLAKPGTTVTVDDGLNIVFDLKVPRAVGEAVIEFHIGVIDMGTDIGVVGNHAWFAAGLPDTLRSVGYGDSKASRLKGELKAKLSAGPSMLSKGEYLVYVCAYDDSCDEVSIAKLRKQHLIGVGTVKLVVKKNAVVKARLMNIENDGPVLGVIDMRSGKLLSIDTDEEELSKFTKMGKGDLTYIDDGVGVLVLRGGRLYNINKAGQKVLLQVDDKEAKDASFYENIGKAYYVQTGDGDCFAVTVKQESAEVVDIEYSPVEKGKRLAKKVKVVKEFSATMLKTRTMVGDAVVDEVKAVNAVEVEETRVFLPDLDDSGKNKAVVLDLATNSLLKLPEKTKNIDKVDIHNTFIELGKGDMAYDGKIGILRGGQMFLYNNTVAVEMEVDEIVGGVTVYKDRLKDGACILVKTGDKREYIITILNRRDGGLELAYHEKK